MRVKFPSAEFFLACKEGLSKDPANTRDVAPSEAYCGFSIEGQLFVFEFDGHACAAVVAGGNPIDLDFVISGPLAGWQRAIGDGEATELASLIQDGTLTIESDEGEEVAHAALPMLQAFVDQAQSCDFELA
jgi:hypothetical protein